MAKSNDELKQEYLSLQAEKNRTRTEEQELGNKSASLQKELDGLDPKEQRDEFIRVSQEFKSASSQHQAMQTEAATAETTLNQWENDHPGFGEETPANENPRSGTPLPDHSKLSTQAGMMSDETQAKLNELGQSKGNNYLNTEPSNSLDQVSNSPDAQKAREAGQDLFGSGLEAGDSQTKRSLTKYDINPQDQQTDKGQDKSPGQERDDEQR